MAKNEMDKDRTGVFFCGPPTFWVRRNMKSRIDETARVNHKKNTLIKTIEIKDKTRATIEDIFITLFFGESSITDIDKIAVRTEKSPKVLIEPIREKDAPKRLSANPPAKPLTKSEISPKKKPKIIGKNTKYTLFSFEKYLETMIEARTAVNHIDSV